MSLPALSDVFSVWRPALRADPKILLDKDEWKHTSNSSTIYARTALIFIMGCYLLKELFSSRTWTATVLCSSHELMTVAWPRFEQWRVDRAMRREVVRQFTVNAHVSQGTMEYAIRHPDIVKELIKKNPSLLDKLCGPTNQNMTEIILQRTLLNRAEKEDKTVLSLLLDANKMSKDHFLKLALPNALISWGINSYKSTTLAIKALKKDAVTVQDFTPEEQVRIWTEGSDQLRSALIVKGWDINIADQQGLTPLKKALVESLNKNSREFSKVCHLLSLGAQTISYDEEISTTDNGSKTIQELINGNSDLIQIFQQARLTLNPKFNKDLKEKPGRWTLGQPLVYVSIIKQKFTIAEGKIMVRSAVVGSIFAAGLILSQLANGGLLAVTYCLIPTLGGVIYELWEARRATHRLHQIALKVFREQLLPWSLITQHIVQFPDLVRELISQKCYMNKLDDQGCTLLGTVISNTSSSSSAKNFESFKLLTDQIFQEKNPRRFEYMVKIFESGYPSYIHYLLSKISDETIPNKEAFACWTNIKDPEIATLFKRHSDVNIKDKAGYTPLMGLVMQSKYEHVKAILAAQPDLDISVEIKNEETKEKTQKKALDLKTTEPIRQLLQQYQAAVKT
jgi:hypothetical protein